MPAKRLKIHFIGIGGIGISALARYYLKNGHNVSGSDLISSEITNSLKKIGAEITIGKNITKKGADLTICSLAVPPGFLRGSRVLSYPQALGELTRKHYTIAVSGTHGKSTTTAMIGLILTKAGFDPTVIVGTKLKEFGDSNCRVGKSKYLVIEADEHFASFLNYRPKIIVITNIEKEHLDFYKNIGNIRKTFKKFINLLPKDGILITGKAVRRVAETSSHLPSSLASPSSTKDVERLKKILKIPGDHNVYNAALALNAARALKIPDNVSFQALSEYKGSWRRFEEKTIKLMKLKAKSLKLISDYAHHPTEIKVTLKAAREKYPKKKIWCVFQPHQYQRTYYLFDDFLKVFRRAPIDKLIITDIFEVEGRENKKIKKKVDAKKLVESINKKSTAYLPKDKIIAYLKDSLKGGEAVIVMGAGDIYKIVDFLKKI